MPESANLFCRGSSGSNLQSGGSRQRIKPSRMLLQGRRGSRQFSSANTRFPWNWAAGGERCVIFSNNLREAPQIEWDLYPVLRQMVQTQNPWNASHRSRAGGVATPGMDFAAGKRIAPRTLSSAGGNGSDATIQVRRAREASGDCPGAGPRAPDRATARCNARPRHRSDRSTPAGSVREVSGPGTI